MPYMFKSKLKIILPMLAIFLFAGILILGSFKSSSLGGMNSYELMSDSVMDAERAPNMKGMHSLGEGTGAITVQTRTGVLPVKLELPRLGKEITVTNYLVTKENPVSLKIWIISSWIRYVFYLVSLLAGLMGYRIYRENRKNP